MSAIIESFSRYLTGHKHRYYFETNRKNDPQSAESVTPNIDHVSILQRLIIDQFGQYIQIKTFHFIYNKLVQTTLKQRRFIYK